MSITGLLNPRKAVIYENYMYVTNNVTNGKIIKINISTNTIVDGDWINELGTPNGIAFYDGFDGKYMFVSNQSAVTNGPNAHSISVINLNTRAVRHNLITGLYRASALYIKENNLYIANIRSTSISEIGLIDLSNFSNSYFMDNETLSFTPFIEFSTGTNANDLTIYNDLMYITDNIRNKIIEVNIL
jgi:hypothetical protein